MPDPSAGSYSLIWNGVIEAGTHDRNHLGGNDNGGERNGRRIRSGSQKQNDPMTTLPGKGRKAAKKLKQAAVEQAENGPS